MKIAYLLLTNGLEYDDRIRKEMITMRSLANVEFKIFAFHGDNHAESGVLSWGVPYEIVSLRVRGGSKGFISMMRKEYDFYSQIKPLLKEYDLLWLCDEHAFFFTLFSNKPKIWDLHELPAKLTGTKIKNFFFHLMERRCKYLIHANPERLNYLVGQGIIKQIKKNIVLRNYPDKEWLLGKDKNPDSFSKFKEWLGGDDDYIYLQGLNDKRRCAYETLAAVLECQKIKAVVIGRVPQNIKEEIAAKYPYVDDFIYYTGQLYQYETASFISHSKFSIVFYSQIVPNNTYCEPNRLFQCLSFGKPVIVGCNEPMKNVINRHNNGIVLKGDGRNIEENEEGIDRMILDYKNYQTNAEREKEFFSWESQSSIFKQIFGIN